MSATDTCTSPTPSLALATPPGASAPSAGSAGSPSAWLHVAPGASGSSGAGRLRTCAQREQRERRRAAAQHQQP